MSGGILPIHVNMLEFLRTGDFGGIRLGMTRQEVREILGEPPNWSITRKRKRSEMAAVWKYGSIEIYFEDASGKVHMIFSDDFPLMGSETLQLDSWILREGLLLEDARLELDKGNLKYQVAEESLIGATRLDFESGVRLRFHPPDEPINGNAAQELTAIVYSID